MSLQKMNTYNKESLEVLSEIEMCILEQIMLGTKKVENLAEKCGITSFIVNAAIRKLVEKNYLDLDMNPTKKAYEKLKWVNSTRPIEYYIDTKKVLKIALEIGIVISFILVVIALVSFLNFI